ncbi:CDP-diacylglycerol diphosphatase [Robbsia sp. KACC 23696]|uniref:CDP-diacylglycerol diphosphatase n=1 Tax=Robbsia sp. KACC 23696 TaxID=3149231 RepID=UPI00325B351A
MTFRSLVAVVACVVLIGGISACAPGESTSTAGSNHVQLVCVCAPAPAVAAGTKAPTEPVESVELVELVESECAETMLPTGARMALARRVASCARCLAEPNLCVRFDRACDVVVLKDVKGKSHYLLLPISSISGIESPDLQQFETLPYLYYAWFSALEFVGSRRNGIEISLAINAQTTRTQDHLHIHLDRVKPDVYDSLKWADVSTDWSEWAYDGDLWHVRRMSLDELKATNVFATIADELPGPADRMTRRTVFITGAPSFHKSRDADEVYLAVRSMNDVHDGHSAESLQQVDDA